MATSVCAHPPSSCILLQQTIESAFANVHCILHAGDIGHHGGHESILARLQQCMGVPVYAVRGNVDDDHDSLHVPIARVLNINGWRTLLIHIVNMPPRAPCAQAAQLISNVNPDIVVFGHSHQHGETHGAHGVWYINPGGCAWVCRVCAVGRMQRQTLHNHSWSNLSWSTSVIINMCHFLHVSWSTSSATTPTQNSTQDLQAQLVSSSPAQLLCCHYHLNPSARVLV